MKLLILTMGSRGDVQPFVALGKGLEAAGHKVKLCTSVSFEPFIRQHGLDYAYMNNELIDFVFTDAARKAVDTTDNVAAWIKAVLDLMGQLKPALRRIAEEGWQAAQGMDAVIYHPTAISGYHIAEKLQIPGILALTMPLLTPTAEFPNIIFPEWPLGNWYNRLSYHFSLHLARLSYRGVVNAWRQETLNLPPQRLLTNELLRLPNGKPLPTLYCYSNHVIPRPKDWPSTTVATGYWFLDQLDSWTPSPELSAFLEAGPPPVYVGFGSMAGSNPEKLTQIVVEALQQTGQRGLIATGWGGVKVTNLPKTLFKIEAAPHDWLFPRMAAVVHHGGAGTTAAGLRAGKPTIICPFFGDQPFWGRRVQALGVGVAPLSQKRITVARLAAAIETAVSDTTMQQKAALVGQQIRAEDGVATAVTHIEQFIQKATTTAQPVLRLG